MQYCNASQLSDLKTIDCLGYTIYPFTAFYAIPYWRWKQLFDAKYMDEAMQTVNSSIVVHLWNYMSSGKKHKIGDTAAIEQLSKTNCPNVYGACGEYF